MRVADGAERKLKIHRLLRVLPVMRCLAKPEKLACPDVIQGALTAAELLAHPRKSCPEQNHPIRVIAFLDDDRFFFRKYAARLRQALVIAGPVVVAPSGELDLL